MARSSRGDIVLTSYSMLAKLEDEVSRLRQALSAARADRDAYLEELTQLKDRLELERTFERAEAYDKMRQAGATFIGVDWSKNEL